MHHAATRTLWTWPLLIAGLVGCDKPGASSVSWLPDPELDMTRAATVAGPPRVKPAPVGEWAPVSGYRPWKYIIVHHSATDSGSAASFDAMHRAKGWDELGYHFVIDSGSGGPDGRVEVGSRWKTQKWGAHTGGTPDNEYNNCGIGICLVGDFTRRNPTDVQLASLARLTKYLMQACEIPPSRVIGHRDAPGAKTDCPGKTFYSYLCGTLRPDLVRFLASQR